MWTSDAIVRSLERLASYPGWAYVVARPHPAFRSSWRDRPPGHRPVRGSPPASTADGAAASPGLSSPRRPHEQGGLP